eukprot:maker-scaffold222_size251774-snap-gene-1.20 protein:Tk11441 transcript:maker-scaffold222_size251774-snap-gene-1.20-mRNA-1 annotation:"hypothetical protein DAPPUDRAFT_316364"
MKEKIRACSGTMAELLPQIRDFLDRLYRYEIPTIHQVQDYVNHNGLGSRMQLASSIGDPSLAFVLYFPIIAGIHYRSGVRFLGTVILCEWLNQVLKWLCFGERPFWWVLENELFSGKHPNPSVVLLEQNPMTCETGPGLPSGHVMMNIVIWLILADTVSTKFLEPNLSPTSPLRIFVNRLVWLAFIGMQVMVTTSRIYNLNHFPHQCMMAYGCGLLVIKLAYHNQSWLKAKSSFKSIVASSFFMISALGVFQGLLSYGFNPDWSIAKAMKWCQNKDWIYIDTTPFYALVRYSGAAFGLGLVLPAAKVQGELAKTETGFHTVLDQGLRIAVGVAFGMLAILAHRQMPRNNLNQFYALEFGVNCALVTLILYAIPSISDMIFQRPSIGKMKSKSKNVKSK